MLNGQIKRLMLRKGRIYWSLPLQNDDVICPCYSHYQVSTLSFKSLWNQNSVYTFKHVSENRFQDSRTFIETTGSNLVASTLKREGISIIFCSVIFHKYLRWLTSKPTYWALIPPFCEDITKYLRSRNTTLINNSKWRALDYRYRRHYYTMWHPCKVA